MDHIRDIDGMCFEDCPGCRLESVTEAAKINASVAALVAKFVEVHDGTECTCEFCRDFRALIPLLGEGLDP